MPLSRKKSCVRCRDAKTRCNQALPTCSRCLDKNVRCIYESERAGPYSRPEAQDANNIPPGRLNDLLVSPDGPLDALLADTWPLSGFSGFSTPAGSAWTPANDVLDAGEQHNTIFDSMTEHLADGNNQGDDVWLIDQAENAYQNKQMRLAPLNTDTIPSKPYSRRRITGQDALASVILGQLKSYPKMMIEGDKLPPFIHPPCHVDEELSSACIQSGRHVCFSKHLSMCASLVQMFYTRTANNTCFVWKTIHEEGERIVRQYRDLGPEEQLAGLQTVVILLLLQAEDPVSAEENGALSLVAIVSGLGSEITNHRKWRLDSARERPRRAEWIWRESLRRTILLLSVIDLLLEGMVGPSGKRCDSTGIFEDATLPCCRDLWEARSTRAWMDSYDRFISIGGQWASLKVKDLIASRKERDWSGDGSDHRDRETSCAVIRWCEGMDALGTLMWMALPLHESVLVAENRMAVSDR